MPARQIIDVHSHALPEVWKHAVADAGSAIDYGMALPNWSPEIHLGFMERAGVSACVLSQPEGTSMLRGKPARELARRMNEGYAEIIADHPGQFGALATLPLDDMDAANAEMEYALDVLGLDGVACVTNYEGHYIGDSIYDDWFAEMNRRGVALFAHPTTPPGFDLVDMGANVSTLEFMFESTRMVTNLVYSGNRLRFPDVKIISTHAGGTIPYLAGRIALSEPFFGAGKGRPTLTREQVESGLASFYYDLTASAVPATLDCILDLVPSSHLLLGHDFPLMPEVLTPPAIEQFEAYAGFDDRDRELVAAANALEIFPKLAARRAAAQSN